MVCGCGAEVPWSKLRNKSLSSCISWTMNFVLDLEDPFLTQWRWWQDSQWTSAGFVYHWGIQGWGPWGFSRYHEICAFSILFDEFCCANLVIGWQYWCGADSFLLAHTQRLLRTQSLTFDWSILLTSCGVQLHLVHAACWQLEVYRHEKLATFGLVNTIVGGRHLQSTLVFVSERSIVREVQESNWCTRAPWNPSERSEVDGH